MDYVNLGNTGLKVSRICLGCMTYGTPNWRDWVLGRRSRAPVLPARAGSGHQLLRHRRHVFARRQRGNHRPRAQGLRQARRSRDRHQGLRRKWAMAQPARPVAQAHHGRHRRLAAAPGHGLRRSLPDSPLRPRNADRGNARSAARRRQGGQGALHRREQHVRVAVRADALHVRSQRLDALRLDAESLQPRLPRGRTRDDPALRRSGHRP